MAILKIARMGHPVLQAPAEAVADAGAPEIARLIADMIETLADAAGAGLAAPQVHVPKRVVIFHMPKGRAGEGGEGGDGGNGGEGGDGGNGGEGGDGGAGGPRPPTVLINPVVEPVDDEVAVDWEGCLSLPDMIGAVPRYVRIRYRALNPDGEAIERTAEGFHARVVQHECDHLDGILYPMRMPDLTLFGFTEEMRRHLPPGGAETL
ncbi:MAG: peptide deformylase [Proteobacteria bacterium]|nr:peptide deformylase [Pseudomonadota bacterium]